MIAWLSADHNFNMCYIVYNACFHIVYEIKSCIYVNLGFISLALCTKIIWVLCWNTILTIRIEISVYTSQKR